MGRNSIRGASADEVLVEYQGGAPLATKRWLIADERGSVIGAANSSGASVSKNAYDEYGRPASTNTGRFQYTGQLWLSEIGLYHYKARLYSPGLGRFLQTDPIGYAAGLNLYGYVGGDPVNATDPSGLLERGFTLDKNGLLDTGGGGISGGGSGGGATGTTSVCDTPTTCAPGLTTSFTSFNFFNNPFSVFNSGQFGSGACGLFCGPPTPPAGEFCFSCTGAVNAFNIAPEELFTGQDDSIDDASDLLLSITLPATSIIRSIFAKLTTSGSITFLETSSIRFTQDSISQTFRNGDTVASLVSGLRSGAIRPGDVAPIRVFQRDGFTFTLDNRRLFAFSQAGARVPTIPATPAQIAIRRFTTPNGGTIICLRGISGC